jgi:hypothetical protein
VGLDAGELLARHHAAREKLDVVRPGDLRAGEHLLGGLPRGERRLAAVRLEQGVARLPELFPVGILELPRRKRMGATHQAHAAMAPSNATRITTGTMT